jgi:hypothetical protein
MEPGVVFTGGGVEDIGLVRTVSEVLGAACLAYEKFGLI